MKEQKRIPTGKVQRAGKFLKAGARVGRNYMKHYARKALGEERGQELLHEDNARDIYESLSDLKGGAMKVAQMMSLNQDFLPKAYQEKFAQAQYSAPPLSYPLVVKTFRDQLGKSPQEVFDDFSRKAVFAASIGQVHRAVLKGNKLAVKVQYPGVADSLKSDLKIVKPLAKLLFNVSDADIAYYMSEVQERLLEETDYVLELQRGMEISEACAHLSGLRFPQYYPELSSPHIVTMDWMEGKHIDDFVADDPSQEVRNKAGKALWDFYDFQIHKLKKMHADAHPGNYLFNPDGTVAVVDFGCVKVIPEDFYKSYFRIHQPEFAADPKSFEQWLYDLSFLNKDDSVEEKEFYKGLFREMVDLLGRPFHEGRFDFGNDDFFMKISDLATRISTSAEIRKSNAARGARDGLYINRTYVGLFHVLHSLQADIVTESNYLGI